MTDHELIVAAHHAAFIRDRATRAYDNFADELRQLATEMYLVGAKDIAEQCMESAEIAKRAARAEHLHPPTPGLHR